MTEQAPETAMSYRVITSETEIASGDSVEFDGPSDPSDGGSSLALEGSGGLELECLDLSEQLLMLSMALRVDEEG